MEALFIGVIVVLLVVVASVLLRKPRPTNTPAPAESPDISRPTKAARTVPDSVPVKTRQYFFSRSEKIFYDQLLKALEGSEFVVFPKPRLDDVFEPREAPLETGDRNRLSNKHIDYLLVTRKGFQPVLGIELDGDSHTTGRQQHNDAVKEVIFRSAGLPLVRFRNEERAMAVDIRSRLADHLPMQDRTW